MIDPKLSLLSNDIKKAQEQQLLRDDIQDRAAHNLQANLTDSINEIGTKSFENITQVIKNTLGRLSKALINDSCYTLK